MTKEELEEKIAGVVEEMNAYIDEGMKPTDALVKAAKAAKIKPGHVKLAAWAYNTGAQVTQFHDNNLINDRFASFPTADPEAAIGRIWGAPKETKIASEYSQPPVWLRERKRQEEIARVRDISDTYSFNKAAEAPAPTIFDPVVKQAEPKPTVKEAFDQLRQHKETCKQLEQKVALARDKMMSAFGKVGDFFHLVKNAEQFDSYRKQASDLYGNLYDPVFDYVKERNKIPDWRCKKASAPITDLQANPWPLLAQCREKCSEFNKAREELFMTDVRGSLRLIDTFEKIGLVVKPEKTAGIGAAAKQLKIPMRGSILGSTADALMERMSPAPAAEAAGLRLLSEVDSPEHLAKLRKLRLEAMLHDFMANDPVIKTHPPDQVLQVFNEYNSLAPEASLQPNVARPAIRRALQGNTDLMEANQIAEIEEQLRKRLPNPLSLSQVG